MSDIYVSVSADKVSASAAMDPTIETEVQRLWAASRASGKAGEVRTFYGVGGDTTVVAVSTGKASVKKGGEAQENAAKELARRNVRIALPSFSPRSFEMTADL